MRYNIEQTTQEGGKPLTQESLIKAIEDIYSVPQPSVARSYIATSKEEAEFMEANEIPFEKVFRFLNDHI